MAECVIPMCGGDGEITSCCGHGHFIHSSCLNNLTASTYPSPPLCPMCRDVTLGKVSLCIFPDLIYMQFTPFSDSVGIAANMIGSRDYTRLKESRYVFPHH